MGRLLDRYDAMQRRPFGTNTALTDGTQNGVGGGAGSQFRRQEQAYGQALRLLSRKARRGDVGSALAAIDVRDKAINDGYSVGGIRNKEQADAGIMGRVEDMNRRNMDLGAASDLTRQQAMESLAPEPLTEGAVPLKGRMGGEPLTEGAMPLKRPDADATMVDEFAGMTFDEIEREKRKRATMSGAFGSAAKDRMDAGAERASGILDRVERRRKQYGNIA